MPTLFQQVLHPEYNRLDYDVLCRMRRCSVAKFSKVQWRDNVSSHHEFPFASEPICPIYAHVMFLQGDGRWGKCHAAVKTVAPIHPATPRQTYPFSDRACPTALTSGFMPKFQCNGCILYPSLTASTSSGTLSPNPHFPACFHAETRIMHHSNYHPCSKTRGKVSDTHHS